MSERGGIGITVVVDGSSVLLVHVGWREIFGTDFDPADELSVEAADRVARGIDAAIAEIRRRQASG